MVRFSNRIQIESVWGTKTTETLRMCLQCVMHLSSPLIPWFQVYNQCQWDHYIHDTPRNTVDHKDENTSNRVYENRRNESIPSKTSILSPLLLLPSPLISPRLQHLPPPLQMNFYVTRFDSGRVKKQQSSLSANGSKMNWRTVKCDWAAACQCQYSHNKQAAAAIISVLELRC